MYNYNVHRCSWAFRLVYEVERLKIPVYDEAQYEVHRMQIGTSQVPVGGSLGALCDVSLMPHVFVPTYFVQIMSNLLLQRSIGRK